MVEANSDETSSRFKQIGNLADIEINRDRTAYDIGVQEPEKSLIWSTEWVNAGPLLVQQSSDEANED